MVNMKGKIDRFIENIEKIEWCVEALQNILRLIPEEWEQVYQKIDKPLVFVGLEDPDEFRIQECTEKNPHGSVKNPIFLDGQLYLFNRNNFGSFYVPELLSNRPDKIYCILRWFSRVELSDFMGDKRLQEGIEFWEHNLFQPLGMQPTLFGCDCGVKGKKAFCDEKGYEFIETPCYGKTGFVLQMVDANIKDKGYRHDAMLQGLLEGNYWLKHHILKEK